MDEAKIKELRVEANQGIEAARRGQADQASLHFNNALNLAEDLEDERTRRDEISTLSALFEHCGFPDLALMAAEEAVDLDRSLGLDSLLGQDIIAVGNAHLKLQNAAQAEASFQEALEMFLKRSDWANAASANTNLAGMVADRGEMAKAIELLETSLGYLAKEPFDDTELNTRFALLQALEFEGRDVDRAIENARQLCARFWNKMPDLQRKLTGDFVARAIERHLQARPQANAAAWKARTFPMLYS
jgi:tetratricopeptide (TPR) repeat protein